MCFKLKLATRGLTEALRVRATEIDKVQNIESYSLHNPGYMKLKIKS